MPSAPDGSPAKRPLQRVASTLPSHASRQAEVMDSESSMVRGVGVGSAAADSEVPVTVGQTPGREEEGAAALRREAAFAALLLFESGADALWPDGRRRPWPKASWRRRTQTAMAH